LANKILPKLESQMKNKYVINIVGKYKLPKYLSKILNTYKSVRIKGFVKNLQNLIRSSNVVLLPTPIVLGSRPRAIFSWSAGSCVIGHKSNQDSLPFFKNNYNCLLGNSSDEIVNHILSIKKKPSLRKKIIFNARKTFEKEFSVSKWKKEFTKITKLNLKTF
jgi:glycosyltransferase involved in cell wall biosynthesis